MNKKELTNLNELLKNNINGYTVTRFTHLEDIIISYKEVYKALNIEAEYHRIINSITIDNSNIHFYDKCYLRDVIEILEDYKIEINTSFLTDIEGLTLYLIDVLESTEKINYKDRKKFIDKLEKIIV